MLEDNAMMETIGRAQDLAGTGDREGASALYNTLWTEALHLEDMYQASIIAHFMAHVHTKPEEQLKWHLRALQAADAVGDERVSSFYPSLHANLGDMYLRPGNLPLAREHTAKARAVEHVLLDNGYGRIIQSLITHLYQTLERNNAPDRPARLQ